VGAGSLCIDVHNKIAIMKHLLTVLALNAFVFSMYVWIRFELPDLRFWNYTPEGRVRVILYIVSIHIIALFVQVAYRVHRDTKKKEV
jgi:hypothetical protein